MRTLVPMGGALLLAVAVGYFLVPGSEGPGVKAQGRSGAALYNPATETSVSGTLMQPPARGRMGLYLSVEEPSGDTVDVRLGPKSYLAARGVSLKKGDELEVTGSKVTMNGAPVLIAREVTKQGRSVTVRDNVGRPLWR